jgi:hypothetical protein
VPISSAVTFRVGAGEDAGVADCALAITLVAVDALFIKSIYSSETSEETSAYVTTAHTVQKSQKGKIVVSELFIPNSFHSPFFLNIRAGRTQRRIAIPIK